MSVLNRLREKNIQIPSGFEQKIREAKQFAASYSKEISDKDVREVFKIADFWKPCLQDMSEYNKLVLYCIIKLYRIQCICLNSNASSKAYIGKVCEVKKDSDLLKRSLTTTLSISGRAVVRGCTHPTNYL